MNLWTLVVSHKVLSLTNTRMARIFMDLVELSEAENDFKCVRFLAILEFVKLKPEWGQLIS